MAQPNSHSGASLGSTVTNKKQPDKPEFFKNSFAVSFRNTSVRATGWGIAAVVMIAALIATNVAVFA